MTTTNEEQKAALQEAIAEHRAAIAQEMTELSAKIDQLERRIIEAGTPIDLSNEIASIRLSTTAVQSMVTPEADSSQPPATPEAQESEGDGAMQKEAGEITEFR